MWTATIIDKQTSDNNLIVTVNYSNGIRSFTQKHLFSGGDYSGIQDVLAQEIRKAQAIDSLIDTVPLIDVTADIQQLIQTQDAAASTLKSAIVTPINTLSALSS